MGDPEQLAGEWLASAPAKFLACRGFGHAFPKPTDRRARKNFRLTREPDGFQVLEMTCRDCGMVRYVTAEPGERITLPAKRYKYDRPDGYSAPKGTGEFITRNVCANAAMERYYEELAHPTGGEEMPRFGE